MIFHRHHPKARAAEWVYLVLLLLFTTILYVRPAVGIAGIGALFVLSSLQVLANKDYIWENYTKTYKKSRGKARAKLLEPTPLAYRLNVLFLWPLILFTGLALIAVSLVAV